MVDRFLRRGWVWALPLLLVLGGCPGNATTTAEERPATALPAADTLDVGDVIEVKVYGEPDLSGSHKVRSDGTVGLPLVGLVNVRGMTPELAADAISNAYAKGYLKNPQVSVVVTAFNSKRFYVLGAVNNPGVFAYEADMNILRAVIMAGGFAPNASKNSVLVTRTVKGVETRIEVAVDDIGQGKAKNFPLLPGDIVYVPTSLL
ncbi:MAG: polysaccharide biosynthesis/export family protein [Myxococcota bacterium]